MRLLRLHLLAYGPFTNVELDLSPAGIHVIYGKNESGKSTALRAITGLLYGIAKNTPDAHVHRMPELRIGGSFAGLNGSPIHVVRRKGKDNTLLDKEGRPVDETVMTRLLRGVSQEQFLSMFGLDHETLRRGGEALLLGRGHAGESLFGAAMAGGELHHVLRALSAEADGLFTSKGHTKPLNEALRALAEANRRTREESMSAESIVSQLSGLDELRHDRAECEATRQLLSVERAKLERARRALPLLAKRRTLAGRRAALGDAVVLPPEARAHRTEQLRIVAEAEIEMERLQGHAADLSHRKSRLLVPESLVRYHEIPLDLANRLGSHRQALLDLPRLHGEIVELEAEARAVLRKTGRDIPDEGLDRWRIDAATQATIRKLALEDARWLEARQHTRRSSLEKEARHAVLSGRRSSLPKAHDITALKKAISRAERDGPPQERWVEAKMDASRLEERAQAQLSSLGIVDLSCRAAARLAVPGAEAVDRFTQKFSLLEREQEHLAKQRLDLQNRVVDSTRDIDTLQRAGRVPSETDLSTARERRDDAWRLARRTLAAPPSPRRRAHEPEDRESLLTAYESVVREADEIVDRLRREAERVSRLAALLSDHEASTKQLAALTEREADLSAQQAADRQAWLSLWRGVGIVPGPPSEMKDWLSRHAALVRTTEEVSGAADALDALRAAIDGHRQRILAMLEKYGHPAIADADLASLLDHATEVVESVETAAHERRQIDRDMAELETELAALSGREKEHELTQAALEDAWRTATAPLGLGKNASPEQVTVTIDLMGEAFHKMDQAEATRRRAASLERHAQAFAADVELLAREHAPDVAGFLTERAAAEIVDRYHRGKAALAEQRELDRQLASTDRMLAAQRDRQIAARSRLSDLMRDAGAESMDDLERAEQKSDEVRALEHDLAQLDHDLDALGGDAVTVQADVGEADFDAASARLADVDAELDRLREHASVLDVRIGSARAGLEELGDPQAKAAEAASDAEAILARAREIAERYLQAKIASLVLAREIERYRQENQGPILTRAGELFRRLTLGSFATLGVDFDEKDQPVLRGVRALGGDIGVEGMSDGTRDQLYLALRLATLERYCESNDPMPLVLDDILIHFDDDRARAALEVLGEVAERTQVLFFTHHARLVELSREAIAASKLCVRELTDSPTPTDPRHRLVASRQP